MAFLEEILNKKYEEISKLPSADDLIRQIENKSRTDFRKPNWDNNIGLIAEIKRKSPSKGLLAEIEDVDALAKIYDSNGANIISVLTDETFFGAKETDLIEARSVTSIPILRKDFIIDEKQVYESVLMGADVILLIVSALKDEEKIQHLFNLATSLNLEVLVEAHDEREVEIANAIGSKLIGVNVRNLSTFEENPELGINLIKLIHQDSVAIWESSIKTIEDVYRAQKSGAKAVLVGQGLVQRDNPANFVKQIRGISLVSE